MNSPKPAVAFIKDREREYGYICSIVDKNVWDAHVGSDKDEGTQAEFFWNIGEYEKHLVQATDKNVAFLLAGIWAEENGYVIVEMESLY